MACVYRAYCILSSYHRHQLWGAPSVSVPSRADGTRADSARVVKMVPSGLLTVLERCLLLTVREQTTLTYHLDGTVATVLH